MKKLSLSLFLFVLLFSQINAQQDEKTIQSIFFNALNSYKPYHQLEYLTKEIGGRLTGSPQAMAAVEYTYQQLRQAGFDTVYLQETSVPHWVRGEKETARIISPAFGQKDVNICALGLSIGTGKEGILSKVIEVQNFEELKQLGEKKVKGKIVFFNRAANPNTYTTFPAYGGAVNQRTWGAVEAAKYGAIGVVIRSVTLAHDYFPHTGVMRYKEDITKIPAVAISTNDADNLSRLLKIDSDLKFYFRTTCENLPNVKSYNVIAEIKGTEFPDEIMMVGGHLDSWETGEGANDDGSGVVQSMEVLRLFKDLNIKPKHTLRAVLFMDEELMQSGGATYANWVAKNSEKHIIAIESDRGSGTPLGFSVQENEAALKKIQSWKSLLLPWGLYSFSAGHSGVDISPLLPEHFPLVGLVTDSQRYFDYHHSPNDIFEHINQRELQLGAASMAALIYLVDIYGL